MAKKQRKVSEHNERQKARRLARREKYLKMLEKGMNLRQIGEAETPIPITRQAVYQVIYGK